MVYVGPIQNREHPKSGIWPFCQYCQLLADSKSELVSFAKTLDIHREPWNTIKCRIPVYYLTMKQRDHAIRNGALPLVVQDVKRYIINFRKTCA